MTLKNKYDFLSLEPTQQQVLAAIVNKVEKYTVNEPVPSFGSAAVAPAASADLITFIPTSNQKIAFIYVSGDGDGQFTLKINSIIVWSANINRNKPNINMQFPVNINMGATITLSVTCTTTKTSNFTSTIIYG